MRYTNAELETLTLEWATKVGILPNGNVSTQMLKLAEEFGELASAIVRAEHADKADIKDAIGDCIVVLTSIAKLSDTSINESWNAAYDVIKQRTGVMHANGNFVKSEDIKQTDN